MIEQCLDSRAKPAQQQAIACAQPWRQWPLFGARAPIAVTEHDGDPAFDVVRIERSTRGEPHLDSCSCFDVHARQARRQCCAIIRDDEIAAFAATTSSRRGAIARAARVHRVRARARRSVAGSLGPRSSRRGNGCVEAVAFRHWQKVEPMDTPERIASHLARNLAGLRHARNQTQQDLARASGVPRSTIANLESGNVPHLYQNDAATHSRVSIVVLAKTR